MKVVLLLVLCWVTVGVIADPLGNSRQLNIISEVDIIEDAYLNFMELLEKYGYPAECHTVTTEDGLNVTLFRIPHGCNNSLAARRQERQVVFLQHGLMSSSTDWIINGPKKSLGYLLADSGYDVWFGNCRGNYYSSFHARLNPNKDLGYWDFSWHDMGDKDLPAVIDYILGDTDKPDMLYVGHSEGATQLFVLGSERPEYNMKVRAFIALGPMAFMYDSPSQPLQAIAASSNVVGWTDAMLESGCHVGEFKPNPAFLKEFGGLLCSETFPLYKDMCVNPLFLFAGYSSPQIDPARLHLYLGHTPAGASVKSIVHYAQIVRSGRFCQYDYGVFGNQLHYGRNQPPEYDLRKLNIPIIIYSSESDSLATPAGVNRIASLLPNLKGMYKVPDKSFNSLDFVWGKDAYKLVYANVLNMLSKH